MTVKTNKFNLLANCFIWVLCLVFSMSSFAKSVEDLIKNNELSIKIKLEASESGVAKQPITLVIEVATNRWFARGTKIHDVTLAETVILPLSEFAINGTERINGTTWAVQTREIVIYPMQVGVYELAPILVDVSINTEHDGIVSGTIQTKALEFETSKPAELKDIEEYIVTPELSIAIEGVFDTNHEYRVGEAITETVTITVKDVPAMMIAPLAKIQIAGVSIYQKPEKLSDKKVRGTITGTREESTTYIFEEAGDHHLPQQTIYWWNPETLQLESEIIPARKWSVAGKYVGNKQSSENTSTWPLDVKIVVNLIIATFLFYIIWQSYKYKKRLIYLYEKLTNKSSRDCKRSFLKAVHNKQWRLACQQLYHFIYADKMTVLTGKVMYQERDFNGLKDYYHNDIEKIFIVNKLLQAAYKNIDEQISMVEAKKIIQEKHKISKNSGLLKHANKIQPNPMNGDA
ncbi:MAG: hypothetical protein RPR97_05010 [Colwellia sp.]